MNMRSIWVSCKDFFAVLQKIVRFIFAPPICFACRHFLTKDAILCSDCDAHVVPVAPKLVYINKYYDVTIYAMCRYNEPLKRMLYAKYYSGHGTFDVLGDLMWQKTIISQLAIDCFIPIPLHWTRHAKRGFNQAHIIANRLSKHAQVPVYAMVCRIKKTEYQARIEQELRNENVHDAFAIKQGFDVKDKHVMLVDDLCTTAATVVAVAKVIAKQRPASISLVVACRAL